MINNEEIPATFAAADVFDIAIIRCGRRIRSNRSSKSDSGLAFRLIRRVEFRHGRQLRKIKRNSINAVIIEQEQEATAHPLNILGLIRQKLHL